MQIKIKFMQFLRNKIYFLCMNELCHMIVGRIKSISRLSFHIISYPDYHFNASQKIKVKNNVAKMDKLFRTLAPAFVNTLSLYIF